jgi:colanic acid/amylovoran biosynthesis glycosyltransferase
LPKTASISILCAMPSSPNSALTHSGYPGAPPSLTSPADAAAAQAAVISPGFAAGAARETILVYRHRLAPLSEVGFLGRFYRGFERLEPVWLGYHLDTGAGALTDAPLRLGRVGLLGSLDRALFRHLGAMPPQPDLRPLRPRLVHAHFGPGGAFALPLARALGVPLVVTFLGGDATKETHYRRRLIPRVYQRRLAGLQREAALFVCVSGFIRERLLARGFPEDKLAVIHQGVEIPDRAPEAPRGDDPYVLFVGRFVEKKGIADLIAAMRIAAASGTAARLVLIGDGPLAGDLRQAALGLPQAEFLGWQPPAEVRRWMRGAVALCVPSSTARSGDAEGLPNVVIEAMAEATPIVATRHAGIAEAIDDGVSGLLVPEGDPPALGAALAAVIAQPDLRRRLGRAARAAAVERFEAMQQSRRLEAALLRVIATAAHAPACRGCN